MPPPVPFVTEIHFSKTRILDENVETTTIKFQELKIGYQEIDRTEYESEDEDIITTTWLTSKTATKEIWIAMTGKGREDEDIRGLRQF